MNRRDLLGLGLLAGAGRPQPSSAAIGRPLGSGLSDYGVRSGFETSKRAWRQSSTPASAFSRTPIGEQAGIITPSGLHFEGYHSGMPQIDPARHELYLHGLTRRALAFSVDELKRLPSVSHIHFIECAGNSGSEQLGRHSRDVTSGYGLLSCSEWSGVRLADLLDVVGLRQEARWVVAEGADAGRHHRSIPLEKCLDDVIVAYGQNGEAVRPQQGYPLRLVVPGWEGNTWVKWLRRIEVSAAPAMSRDEAAGYTELLPGGIARRFSVVMEVKSVITWPSGGQRLTGGGPREIRGFAWSGQGRVSRVEVSTDGGRSWLEACLEPPVLPKSLTVFRLPWRWDGKPTVILSRAADERGALQPTREEIVARRGAQWMEHYNGIKAWRIEADGNVSAL